MESTLTKEIKSLIHGYNPRYKSSMRSIRWADEVWTQHGIVDSIRFEDYKAGYSQLCRLIDYKMETARALAMLNKVRHTPLGECKLGGTDRPRKECHGCIYKYEVYHTDMMITAYEVKITVSDFNSDNGHNIDDAADPIGNENYYVVPKEIVKKIENKVPEHCGIITYNKGSLRIYKKPVWLEVDDNTKVTLLYNALKKWCDKAVYPKGDNGE